MKLLAPVALIPAALIAGGMAVAPTAAADTCGIDEGYLEKQQRTNVVRCFPDLGDSPAHFPWEDERIHVLPRAGYVNAYRAALDRCNRKSALRSSALYCVWKSGAAVVVALDPK